MPFDEVAVTLHDANKCVSKTTIIGCQTFALISPSMNHVCAAFNMPSLNNLITATCAPQPVEISMHTMKHKGVHIQT